MKPGVVIHAYNPRILGGRSRRIVASSISAWVTYQGPVSKKEREWGDEKKEEKEKD